MKINVKRFGLVLTALTVAGLALVLAVLVLTATPVLADPGTIYVDDDTCPAAGAGTPLSPFCSIQDGLDAAADGDTVSVAAGDYDSTNETFPLTLNTANVNLDGAGAGTTTIDGEGTGTIIEIEADGITVQDFAIVSATYGITSSVGGFSVLDNLFSNDTDHDIGTGVHVNIDETDRATNFTFDDVLIEGNEFYISSDGVYIDLNLDFDDTLPGLSATVGDVDILDNVFDMGATDGVDIRLYVTGVSTGTVSIGDVDISSTNVFSEGNRGVYFDAELKDFTDTTVTVGDFMVNDNTFESQADTAVYVEDYYYSRNWHGTTTASFGDLEINGNDISSDEVGSDGIRVNDYAEWQYLYDDVVVTAGNIYINDNDPIDVEGNAIDFEYFSTRRLYDNASVTLGDLSIQGNHNIDAGDDGIWLQYDHVGHYMYDASQVTIGEVHIGGTGVGEGNTIIDAGRDAIRIKYNDVAHRMWQDDIPCQARLVMGDIYVQDNDISGDNRGLYLEYHGSPPHICHWMDDDAYAELPDYVITGNTFNVSGDGIYLDAYRFPSSINDDSTCDFGGALIDDNTFDGEVYDPSDPMDYGVYFKYDNFGDDNNDDSTTIVGDVTITNNEFYDLGDDAVYIYYYYMGNSMRDNANLEVGDLVIADNTVAGTGSDGLRVDYNDVESEYNSTVTLGNLDITGNDVSGVTADGIYVYYYLDADDTSTQTIGRALIQENSIVGCGDNGVYLYATIDAEANAVVNLGDPIIHCNDIVGNTTYGVNNDTGQTVDAEDNWWGHASGPTHASNPGGSGDAVTDDVDYDPWLSGLWEETSPCWTPPPEPVGGIVVPVNKLGLLVPWLGLAALTVVAVAAVVVRRRRSA